MKINMLKITLLVMVLMLVGCGKNIEETGKPKVVVTTTMLTDLVNVIGGEKIELNGLMGPGIDPHMYKPTPRDISLVKKADMIILNGLHLEGKMGEIFESLDEQGKLVIEVGENIDKSKLIPIDETGLYDPHIWFDVSLWKIAAEVVREALIELSPENSEFFINNYEMYSRELDSLDNYVKEQVIKVEEERRVLITAHDAFAYFGKAYGYEVRGLQGISTASEAGTLDVSNLAKYISEKKIKAIFIESSVSQKNIKALQEAVIAKGFNVSIGGELYSDSLGSENTDTQTYIGTVKSNIDTIVNALK